MCARETTFFGWSPVKRHASPPSRYFAHFWQRKIPGGSRSFFPHFIKKTLTSCGMYKIFIEQLANVQLFIIYCRRSKSHRPTGNKWFSPKKSVSFLPVRPVRNPNSNSNRARNGDNIFLFFFKKNGEFRFSLLGPTPIIICNLSEREQWVRLTFSP